MKILFLLLFCFWLFSLESQEQNILQNGDFEKQDPQDSEKPLHWEKPDGLGIQWLEAPFSSLKKNKAICMDTSISEIEMVKQWKEKGSEWNIPDPQKNPVAATYGLSYYSDPVSVLPNQDYSISFDVYSPIKKKGAKVWVRGYTEEKGKKRRIYETVVHCRIHARQWQHFSQVFHPTRYRKEVKEIRVMLYAYWPPGKYWFDNIQILPVNEEREHKTQR